MEKYDFDFIYCLFVFSCNVRRRCLGDRRATNLTYVLIVWTI